MHCSDTLRDSLSRRSVGLTAVHALAYVSQIASWLTSVLLSWACIMMVLSAALPIGPCRLDGDLGHVQGDRRDALIRDAITVAAVYAAAGPGRQPLQRF